MTLRLLGTLFNWNRKRVVNYISETFISRENGRAKPSKARILFFLRYREADTREYVLLRWAFGKNPKEWFTTTINDQILTYEKFTVLCCQKCDNEVLNEMMMAINVIFSGKTIYLSFKIISLDPGKFANLVKKKRKPLKVLR